MNSTLPTRPSIVSAKAAKKLKPSALKLVHRLESLIASQLISEKNKETIIRVLYDAVKVLACREQRLRKPQLKEKEVAGALRLIHFYHTNVLSFQATGILAKNFGSCPEAEAVRCYNEEVLGEATDRLGRKIIIPQKGVRSLYKAKDPNGKHTMCSENYVESRGKRLPWIRHTIENSKAILQVWKFLPRRGKRPLHQRSFLYTARVLTRFSGGQSTSHFLVVVKEVGNRNLEFVTAFAIDRYNTFLKRIEEGEPLGT